MPDLALLMFSLHLLLYCAVMYGVVPVFGGSERREFLA
jgi:hypothetical protein